MSLQINIPGWSGDDQDEATRRLAKVFRMPLDQASVVVRGIASGKSWSFEKSVSDGQGARAQAYLEQFGFQVELTPPGTYPAYEKEGAGVTPAAETPARGGFMSFFRRSKKPAPQEGEKPAAGKTSRSGLKAAVILLLVLGAAAAVPVWFGMQVENIFNEAVKQWEQKGMVVQVLNYERRWLDSTAYYTIRMPRVQTSPTLNVESRIIHGPVNFTKWLEFDFQTQPFQAQVDSTIRPSLKFAGLTINNLPRIRAVETIPFEGDWQAQAAVLPFQMTLKIGGGVKVDWLGMEGVFTFPADLKRMRGNFTSKPLSLSSKRQKLFINKITGDLNTHEGPAGLTIGTGTLEMDSIKIQEAHKAQTISKVKMVSSTTAAGNDINSSFGMQVKEIKIDGGEMIGPVNLKMQARKLDAAQLVKWKNVGMEIQKQQSPGGDPKKAADLQKQMMRIFSDMARKVPEFEISQLNIQTSQGPFDAHAKLIIDGRQVDLASNPLLALSVIDLTAGMSIAEPLLREIFSKYVQGVAGLIPGQSGKKPMKPADPHSREVTRGIQKLVKDGLLVREGEGYKIGIAYRKGKLEVNGKPRNTLSLTGN